MHGFFIIYKAPENRVSIDAEDDDDQYYEKLAIIICNCSVFLCDIWLVFSLKTSHKSRDGVTDSLRYHVNDVEDVHDDHLCTEIFSLAQAELIL